MSIGETAAGIQRAIPILGGTVGGPRLRGKVLPGGADFQLLRKDGVTELRARYTLQCDDGALIDVDNRGMRHGPAEAMERLRRGEEVDPALMYFRAIPRFETASESCLWLTRYVFECDGIRRPGEVALTFYQVL